jgi:hypothetical protein
VICIADNAVTPWITARLQRLKPGFILDFELEAAFQLKLLSGFGFRLSSGVKRFIKTV